MPTFINPRDRFPTDDLCLYRDKLKENRNYPNLDKDKKTQICVIGAGFTGLLSAYYLKQYGFDVTVVERHRVGWGASGRNSGQVIPGYNQDIRVIARKYGVDIAKASYQATVEALGEIRRLIEKQNIDCDFKPGLTITATDKKSNDDLGDHIDFLREKVGYKTDFIDASETAKDIGTTLYEGAMRDDFAGCFNPLKYITSIASICAEMGVEIFEETPALSMKKTASGKMEITTPKATITADQVIAAGDAYQGRLLPNLRKKYVLLRTSMLATEVLSDDIYDQILPSNHAVFEWQNLTNYYTKTADKRLIFGGGDAPLTRNKTEEEKAFKSVYGEMIKLFPSLQNIHITHWWGGYFSATLNELPQIGCLDDKIHYALGFCGHGVVPTHMSARLMAARIAGDTNLSQENPDFAKAFRTGNIPFAGKYDHHLVGLGMIWHKIKDMF